MTPKPPARRAKKGRSKPVKAPARFTVDEWCAIMGFMFRGGSQGAAEWSGFMDAHTRRFVAWWEKSVTPRKEDRRGK